MAIRVSLYMYQMKVNGIIRLRSEWREESGGYNDEHTNEEIFCLVEGQPHHMSVHWLLKFSPSSTGYSYTVVSDKQITPEEYQDVLQRTGSTILDSPEVIAKIKRRNQLNRDLLDLIPNCPKCDMPMDQRESRLGFFWGCSRYPKCNGKRNWNEELKARIDKIHIELKEYEDL